MWAVCCEHNDISLIILCCQIKSCVEFIQHGFVLCISLVRTSKHYPRYGVSDTFISIRRICMTHIWSLR